MNRKIIFVILGVITVLILGYFFLWMKSGFIDHRPQANEVGSNQNYYNKLTNKCKSKQSESCCLASVEAMKQGGYTLIPQGGCPTDYQPNTMLCIDSYRWCQPTEKTSQSTNKISNWATYTNTKYDYQIKYPTDWVVEVDGVVIWQNQVPNPELGNSVVFFGTKTKPYGQTARTLWNIKVFISPAENSKKLSPRSWYVEQSKLHFSYGVEQKFDNLEDTTFKGLPALKVKGSPDEGYGFIITKGSTIYNLAFGFEKFSGSEFPVPPEDIFLEMLDSLILN